MGDFSRESYEVNSLGGVKCHFLFWGAVYPLIFPLISLDSMSKWLILYLHFHWTQNSVSVGTSHDFSSATSLVPELNYVLSKLWLKKYIFFCCCPDTGGNGEYRLCKYTDFF